jgi:hypothetical protein
MIHDGMIGDGLRPRLQWPVSIRKSGILISKALNSLCMAQRHLDDASGRFLISYHIVRICAICAFARSQTGCPKLRAAAREP